MNDINEQYRGPDLLSEDEHEIVYRGGERKILRESVLAEHVLSIFLNGAPVMKLVCTPENLAELVLGRLLTEGIITSFDDVEMLSIGESGSQARVILREGRVSLTGSAEVHPVCPIPWKTEWIFSLADRFQQGMPLHRETWATHSCFLSMDGGILFQCEDIGRHNAFDKVIGYALREGIDLAKCIVYSSGRIPTDMAMKAIRAGIPVLASKAVPTREAIALAKEYGLTLIGAARIDRMKVYADCGENRL